MDPLLVNQIIVAASTLLASLGGYLLAGRNERRRDDRALRRELRLRVSERKSKLDDNRHTIQRETLLSLQDAVQAMARFTGKTLHFDHMQARQGKYTQLPDTLSDDSHANLVEVRRLASRIIAPDVRAAVDRFVGLTTKLASSPKDLKELTGDHLERFAIAKVMELNDGYDEITRILGEAVRSEIAWLPEDAIES
ncbi:hypothetical protein [Paenarthrobacter nicotinovorans]|uniref:hypothetical protein n=1 Tax=Paenarthrobacter nicotinovorans TaxID=29320 RepID=UPI0011A91B24|nr:hypothetical protein [Paenarthrobacter nicotinovorans]